MQGTAGHSAKPKITRRIGRSVNRSCVTLRTSSGCIKNRRGTVVYSYTPENDDELRLQINDVVELLNEEECGWWRGRITGKEKEGLFPINCVKLIDGNKSDTSMLLEKQNKVLDLSDNFELRNIINVDNKSSKPRKSEQKCTSSTSNKNNKPESQEYAKTIFAYDAENDDELSFKEHEIILILSKTCEDIGWWYGEIVSTHKRGLFPDNFVEIIPSEEVKDFSAKSTQSVQNLISESPKSQLSCRSTWNVIGRGTFADVYSALYNRRPVAIKQFQLPIDATDEGKKEGFGEASLLKSLSHEFIVSYIDYIEKTNGKEIWLVTELVDGGSMRRFCTGPEKGINVKEKYFIASCCWKGLAYLHQQHVIHKDVKPENILVSSDRKVVKIADFGIAEFKIAMSAYSTNLKGTCLYYPPEFASKNHILRHPELSDIYSMGASLCELFSGQYFWSKPMTDGLEPRDDAQVMFKLVQQIQNIQNNKPAIEPDCWSHVDSTIKSVLKLAIAVEYKERKTANDLSSLFKQLMLK